MMRRSAKLNGDSVEIAKVDGGRSLRVLIVRIGAMGDVLHAMPAVAALRELHPEWSIGWAIEPGWSELLECGGSFDGVGSTFSSSTGSSDERGAGRPLVDVVHKVSAKAWAGRPFAGATWPEVRGLRRDLRACRYDVCVDMQGAFKSAVVGRMAGAEVLVGAAEPREAQARWLYGRRVPVTAKHVVEQGCELLGRALGETLRPARVTLPVGEETEAWCERLLDSVVGRRARFAFIAPTAGWGAKQWPAARYGAVAAALGRAGFRTLVNVASTGETGGRVVAASEGAAALVPCSLGQLIALVRRAGVVIAGDTGPLHLAAALERPVVGLFGPTDPQRNGPFGTRSIVLRHGPERRDHRRRKDPEAGLLEITVDEVVEASLELLRSGQDKVGV